ncbi:hypothetical protein DMN91_004391 [Ooceraea biroi]|uniref:Odorant receptor n=1 Tax=Ooceraea biroi TaxID=2015173 RepID=A0A026VTB4_OOCBI|nr:uncharacterized protein LOC105286883 [Ooceraea biroi]EZA47028.1 hypothetical protein X777_17004 [Ooceraea biroi]RLU23645.1 hypothetical protein DMN91_003851 [Ooceraea biroi]RLU24181.1 hypothetical protein DMN91_004391 [Ooceraea biroi]
MVCIKKRFFNPSRLLLLAFGLWPDKETIFTRFQATFLCSFLISSIVFQLSRVFIAECNFDLIVRIVSSTTFFTMLTILPFSFWVNIKTITYLLDQLQYIYDRLKDRNEIAIYDKYGNTGKQFATIVIILLVCGLSGNSVIIYWPYILDIVVPKNESYAIHMMQFVTEYFNVSEKYYFLVVVHLNAACSTGLIVLAGTGTIFFSYLQQTCGMFEIASYRIEQAMATELLHNFDIKNTIGICREIICAIDIQRQAMQCAKGFITSMEGTIFVLVITLVLCVSCNLFRIFQIESPMERMDEVLLHFSAVFIVLMIMFLSSYVGQDVTDHSNYVYVITYNVAWYLAPLHIQKLILFLLQRSNKSCTLSVGGLFTASLECFATLFQASMSYFTFMYSMQ